MTPDIQLEFSNAFADSGLTCPRDLIIDGALHRYRAEGDREANSWYIAHTDGVPTITIGCWKRGIKESKDLKTGTPLSPQKRAEIDKKIEADRIKRETDERAAHESARQTISKILAKARQNPLQNAYCKRKGVKAPGVYEAIETAEYDCLKTDGERQKFAVRKGDLIVPIRKDGKVTSLQIIPADGKKLFLAGGDIKGGCFRIGNPAGKLTVCEGFATGASIHEATGDCIAVAFSAGNLLAVAESLRVRYPDTELTIAADNDAWTAGNPGVKSATLAAQAVNARVAIPQFNDSSSNLTDFNDLHKLKGLDEVRAQMGNAVTVAQASNAAANSQPEHPPTVAYNDGVTVRLLNGGDLEPEIIRWLWEGWLAGGKLHVMAGAPGTGKTTIALALAATVSMGGRFPDGSRCEAGNVLIWSGEDNPKDTLLPRLLAMGADRKRIYFVSDAYEAGKQIPFDPAKHFPQLAEAAIGIGGIKLMIVDPIVSAVAGDSHKAAEVRRSLQPVVDLAGKLNAAMVGIPHFSKGTAGNDPLERVTGSNAFGALPRVVMATAKVKDEETPDAPARRILVRTKSNIGPDGGGYNYSLEQSAVKGYPNLFASCVLWGDGIEGSAKQLLATAEADTDPDEQNEHKSAEDWLREMLDETEGMPAGEVIRTAKANGYSERTIYRVKNRLCLVVKTTGFGKERVSIWSLPISAKRPVTDSITAITANLESGNNGSYGGSNGENGGVII